MASEYLSSYIENSGERAEDTVPELIKKPSHELAVENCFHYRQHAGSSFLHTGNTTTFFECMHRSAGCFLYMLKNEMEAEKRSSENEPLFDAVCAGLLDAAGEIAEYSRASCNFDYEYEDDFLYFHFIATYFFRREAVVDCETILKKYEEVLDGDLSTRLDICTSFFKKDPDMFRDSFDQFLNEREELINQQIEGETIGEEEWAWSKYISVEALALLKLATLLNFKTETNYRQAPESLRHPPKLKFDPDLWRSSMGVEYREE